MYTNLLGKKYWPTDNSFAVCLTDGRLNYSLSGNLCSQPKQPEETEVISDPYEVWLWPFGWGVPCAYTFINVKCKRGLEHRVLFNVRGFEPHVNKPISLSGYSLF